MESRQPPLTAGDSGVQTASAQTPGLYSPWTEPTLENPLVASYHEEIKRGGKTTIRFVDATNADKPIECSATLKLNTEEKLSHHSCRITQLVSLPQDGWFAIICEMSKGYYFIVVDGRKNHPPLSEADLLTRSTPKEQAQNPVRGMVVIKLPTIHAFYKIAVSYDKNLPIVVTENKKNSPKNPHDDFHTLSFLLYDFLSNASTLRLTLHKRITIRESIYADYVAAFVQQNLIIINPEGEAITTKITYKKEGSKLSWHPKTYPPQQIISKAFDIKSLTLKPIVNTLGFLLILTEGQYRRVHPYHFDSACIILRSPTPENNSHISMWSLPLDTVEEPIIRDKGEMHYRVQPVGLLRQVIVCDPFTGIKVDSPSLPSPPPTDVLSILFAGFEKTPHMAAYHILPPLIWLVVDFLGPLSLEAWDWEIKRGAFFAPPSTKAIRSLIIPHKIHEAIQTLKAAASVSGQDQEEKQRVMDALTRLENLIKQPQHSEKGLLTIIQQIEEEYADLKLSPQYKKDWFYSTLTVVPTVRGKYAQDLRDILESLLIYASPRGNEVELRARLPTP